MVVSSPGILQALNFYHTVFADGLVRPRPVVQSEQRAQHSLN